MIKRSNVLDYLIYLFILLIPLTHKELFSVFLPDLIWSKFILVFFATLGFFLVLKKRKFYRNDIYFISLFIILLFNVLSLFQTSDLIVSLQLVLFLSSITFLYPVYYFFIEKNKGDITKLLKVYLISYYLLFAFLVVQVYIKNRFNILIGGIWPVPEFPTRYGSTFWDVNHFAAFVNSLAFVFFSSFLVFKEKKKRYLSYLFLLASLLSLVSLYLSSSRSAMIGFFVGVFVMILLLFSNTKKKSFKEFKNWYYIASSFLLLIIPSLLLFFGQEIIRKSFLYRSVSFFSHLFLVKVGIIVGIKHFLTGIGTNSFYAYFKTSEWAGPYYYIDAAALNYKLPLHNLWLEVFAETGIVSFLFFTLFWVILIFGLYKLYKKKNDVLSLGFLSGLVAWLTSGFMYSYRGEFFWSYVVLASAYVSYNLFHYDKKISLKESVKVIFGSRESILKIAQIFFSFILFLVPVFFIFNPLFAFELKTVPMNKDLYELLRYVFGNYSFLIRLPALLLYFASSILLIGLLKRYFNLFTSVVLGSVVLSSLSLFYPVIATFNILLILFVFLSLFSIVILFIKEKIESTVIKVADLKIIIVLLALVIGSIGMQKFYYRDTFDKDLSFLLELASNRLLFKNGSVVLLDEIDTDLVHYYCDVVDMPKHLRVCNIEKTIPENVDISILPDFIIVSSSTNVSIPKLDNELILGDWMINFND